MGESEAHTHQTASLFSFARPEAGFLFDFFGLINIHGPLSAQLFCFASDFLGVSILIYMTIYFIRRRVFL